MYTTRGARCHTPRETDPPMPRVLIAPATLAGRDGRHLQLLREAGFDLAYPPHARQLTEDEVLEQLAGVSAVIAGSEPYTRRVLQANPQLRVIARAGVGYDAVDVVAATECGVAVTITPGTNHDAVAEYTFALILALAKNLIIAHHGTRAGNWPRLQPTLPLRGRALGIVGLGRIGKAVAVRGAAFGMGLLAHEPYPDLDFVEQHRVTLLPLERLLAEADWVSLHVPLTPASRYLIDRRTLALMKPTAYLINTARGALVCEDDLLEALVQRRIAGAGLDVFEQEPPAPGPLLELDNVVLTPHAAGVDLQSRDDMAAAAAGAIVALSRGAWPAEQVVNPQVRERFRW
jgi:D-3-phosphoglycerate dehydrogenase / 2-oxoglutarate reductase